MSIAHKGTANNIQTNDLPTMAIINTDFGA